MERVPPRCDTPVIDRVLRSLPRGFQRLLGNVPFVVDTCPVWIGLHAYRAASDGRPYSVTSHVAWQVHQRALPCCRREDTIVLQGEDATNPDVILHELGHVLDARLGFDRPGIWPLGEYAARNTWEAFATAFQAWNAAPGPKGYGFYCREDLIEQDPDACAFFAGLE